MAIHRLNHAVLYVRDIEATLGFYRDLLGFRVKHADARMAFLQAPDSTNDHDVAFFAMGAGAQASTAGRASVGLYHLAWEVDTLAELERHARLLAEAGALRGSSDHGTTKSLYAHDPDGLELEIVWIIPADLLDDEARGAATTIRPLDLRREIDRYGADTRGGIGISVPAP